MNNWQRFLSIFLFSASAVFAVASKDKQTPQSTIKKPQGWSFDIGGSFTWMSFLTPPTYSGPTGGILGNRHQRWHAAAAQATAAVAGRSRRSVDAGRALQRHDRAAHALPD